MLKIMSDRQTSDRQTDRERERKREIPRRHNAVHTVQEMPFLVILDVDNYYTLQNSQQNNLSKRTMAKNV